MGNYVSRDMVNSDKKMVDVAVQTDVRLSRQWANESSFIENFLDYLIEKECGTKILTEDEQIKCCNNINDNTRIPSKKCG
jgi:hypothetical protein